MPRKPKAQPVELPAIPAELLEQFGNGPMTAEAINAATLALKNALIERALSGEMNHHLGYPSGAAKPANATNQGNGRGAKTVLTEDGPIRIEVPRDRDGSFEPILIPKHERRFAGFDALRVKIREDAVVRNKAVYLALGVLPDGTRDILGLWIENTEGAKFWMKVFNDLKTRGVRCRWPNSPLNALTRADMNLPPSRHMRHA